MRNEGKGKVYLLESRPALELVEPETERATSTLDQLQTTCY